MTQKPTSKLDHLRATLARAETSLSSALKKNPAYEGVLQQDYLRALRLLKDEELRCAKSYAWPDPGKGTQP